MDAEEKRKALGQLLLHGDSVASCGLFWGKSGIALALFHEGVEHSVEPITDYAGYLLEKVATGFSKYAPLGLADGMAGVGWTFEFLAQHHYLCIDTAEACREIDQRIMDFNPSRLTDTSLETGWTGILTYMVSHLQGNAGKEPFDREYLLQLKEAVETVFPSAALTAAGQAFLRYMEGRSFALPMDVLQFVRPTARFDPFDLSLRTGLAGRLVV